MTKENLTKEEKIEKHIEWLVDNEIYCCASWIMDDLLKYAEEYPKDAAIDIEEYWEKQNVCPECGCRKYSDFNEYKEEHPDFDVEKYNKDNPNYQIEPDVDYDYICDDCGTVFNEPKIAEIYEYYFVSDYLAEELEKVGEIVLTQPWIPIWCRCCTGQSIKLDYCMEQIAKKAVERLESLK